MMEGFGKISDVQRYIDASVELDLAAGQRRISLVSHEEVARMGKIAFPGDDAEMTQSAVDHLVDVAIISTTNPTRAAEVQGEDAGLAAIVGPEMGASLLDYAKARVEFTIKQAAKAEQRSAGATLTGGLSPMVYLGTWKDDAEYQRGNTVTLNGTLWHCEGERVVGRPGQSQGWKLMHKSMEGARR